MTPLHIAVNNSNFRSVNVLLDKLGYINVSNSESIKDLFKKLLDFVQFNRYLNTCFFSTN